jgi:hypothetical protein
LAHPVFSGEVFKKFKDVEIFPGSERFVQSPIHLFSFAGIPYVKKRKNEQTATREEELFRKGLEKVADR